MVVGTGVGVSLGAVVGVAGIVLVGDVHPATRISAMQATTIKRDFDESKCIFHCYISCLYSFLWSHSLQHIG